MRYVRELLKTRFGIGPVDLSLLTQRDMCAFISACATRMSPASVGTVTTAMAGFLRYLQFRGVGDTRWAGAFPRSAVWSLATLPRVLTDAEVEAFLAAFDPTVEVPPSGILGPSRHRPVHHIFTTSEIAALVTAARQLVPVDALRPATYATMFGLLAASAFQRRSA